MYATCFKVGPEEVFVKRYIDAVSRPLMCQPISVLKTGTCGFTSEVFGRRSACRSHPEGWGYQLTDKRRAGPEHFVLGAARAFAAPPRERRELRRLGWG